MEMKKHYFLLITPSGNLMYLYEKGGFQMGYKRKDFFLTSYQDINVLWKVLSCLKKVNSVSQTKL